MGFGSYDESEQEKQVVETDDTEEAANVKESGAYNGDVEFTGATTDEMVDRLDDIKSESEES